ncbi:MAG: choice-of-anchor L domain-containing protein [Saprospiraceae bacterium]|nr:choice-of-anchor L domain-containing protein [Saprospiraceae bacterium]
MRPLFTLAISLVFLFLLPVQRLIAQNQIIPITLEQNACRTSVTLASGLNSIELCNLTPGMTYGFMLNGLPIQQCLNEVLIINGPYSLVGVGNPMTFKATEACATVVLDVACEQLFSDMDVWFSAFCMNCKPDKVAGPRYSVNQNADADFLIREVFIGGGCFDVSGVSTIGNAAGLGEFSDGGDLGIESGVIMASGNVTNSIGPNNAGGAGNSFGEAGDPDLNLISGQNTFDATGIEFDFAPTLPQITFNYCFASEEYPEYVCAIFNDVFGFFISGPGISGGFTNNAENLAWIPGFAIPVGINSVNPGVPGSNGSAGGCGPPQGSLNFSQYYVDNTGGQDLQYDGWTSVFQAVANVEVCGTYHIKLVVADAGDGIFDSAVFLEGNSFNAGGTADMAFQAPSTGTNLVYEACNDGIITICKASPSDLDLDVTLEFTVDPSSTATPGVDYEALPPSFFIPAGEECVEFQLNVFYDLIAEGVETIQLALELPCSCENPFITILIADTPPLGVELQDFTVCQNEQVDLNALVSGGVPGFEYLWTTGEIVPDISVFPSQNTTYTVTVTDQCGQEEVANANVTVIPRPIATLDEEVLFLCAGDPNAFVEVTVHFEPPGSQPWTLNYSVDGEQMPTITNITTTPIKIKIYKPGFVTLTDVSSSICEGTVEGFAIVEEVKVEAFYDVKPVSCQGINDGSIQAIGVGLFDPYSFFWSNGWGETDLLDPVGVGTYYVTVTDALGCVKRDSVIISSPSDITVSGNVTGGTECFSATGSVVLFVSGGQTPYAYLWSNGNTAQNPTNLGAGLNYVTVTDSRGCEAYANFNIIASDAPTAVAIPLTPVTCANPTAGSAQLNVTGGTPPYNFLWSNGGGTNQNPLGLMGGTYQVTVTDDASCTITTTVLIPSDTITPLAAAGNPDTLTCGQASLQLDGLGSAQGNQYSYQWATTSGQIISGATSLTPLIGLPGTYVLVVTDQSNGCTSSDNVIIAPDLNAPQITIDPASKITCSNTSIMLDASSSSSGPGFQATWTTPNGTILSGGNSLTPTVGAGGVYVLTILNANNNCISTQDITVEADNALPIVDIAPPLKVTCLDPVISLDGTGSQSGIGITYQWSGNPGNIVSGGTSNSPNVNAPGVYTLVVTNTVTGCVDSKQVTVLEDKVPPIAVTGVSGVLTCKDNSVELIGFGSSEGPNISHRWTTFNGNITGDPNQINTTVDAASTYLLTVVNNTNGCQTSQSIQVLIDTIPPISFAGAPVDINCGVPQALLDGTLSSNAPFFSYQWTTTNGNIVNGAGTLTPLIDKAGIYTLIVTDDLNGCTAQSVTFVNGDFLKPTVIIEDPDKLTCTIDQVILDASNSDFNSNVSFQWNTTGGNILSGANTVTPIVNAPGVYSLTSVNSSNGCTGSGSVVIVEDKLAPIADAGKPGEIYCLGDSVKLDGSKSSTGTFYSYDWYTVIGGPAAFLNQQTPFTENAGTYYLVVTDSRNGCTDIDEVIIGSDYLTSAAIKMTDPICFDDPGTLEIYNVIGGLYPYEYSINGGQTYQYNPRFRNLTSGAYKIIVRDAKGCLIKDDFEIPEVNQILVHVEPEITIKLGENIRLEAQLNIDPSQMNSITWYPAYGLDRTDSLVVFGNPYITTPYFITVVDTFGCEGKTQFKIVVQDPEIFVPTAFSPYNNDGNNDKLMIFAGDFGIAQIDLFEVFTRWGERVFKAENFQPNDETYGWNGLHQGETMNPAVFVYYAKVRLIDGRILTIKGDVNLMN